MALAHVFVHIMEGKHQNNEALTSPSQLIKKTKFWYANAMGDDKNEEKAGSYPQDLEKGACSNKYYSI